MKARIILLSAIFFPAFLIAQTPVRLMIKGADCPGGRVYVSVFNNEKGFKDRTPNKRLVIDTGKPDLTAELDLPDGDYVISAYQDENGNQKLDTNLIGIPKEKFGFSNYQGKNAPGSFDRHKVCLRGNSRVVCINLYRI